MLSKRPMVVSLIALLMPLHAALYSIGALLTTRTTSDVRVVLWLWAIIGILVAFVTAIGLWQLKRWALVTMVLWVLNHNIFLIATTNWHVDTLVTSAVFLAATLNFRSFSTKSHDPTPEL